MSRSCFLVLAFLFTFFLFFLISSLLQENRLPFGARPKTNFSLHLQRNL